MSGLRLMAMACPHKGFTLIEMLVVLLISGMALTLGFQALDQWRQAQASISSAGGDIREMALTESWLRDEAQGLIALDDSPLKGTRDGMSGVTLNPLLGLQGGATPFEWKLTHMGNGQAPVLEVREDGHLLALALPEGGEARLSYYAKDGKEHSEWPPRLGLQEHIPAMIVLTMKSKTGDRDVAWGFRIIGPADPVRLPFEMGQD